MPNPKYIKILQWNIRSTKANRSELISIIRETRPHVILLNETWLNNQQKFFIKNYNIIRQDRQDGYGGIATCITNNLKFSIIHNAINADWNNLQYITIKIGNINIINAYSPPQNNFTKEILSDIFSHLTGSKILMGDMNALHSSCGSSMTNQSGKALMDFLNNSDFILLSDGTSTRLVTPNSTSNPLDITIVDPSLGTISNWEVFPDCGNSDHFPTICKINCRNTNNIFFSTYQIKDFSKADWGQFYDRMVVESMNLERDASFQTIQDIMDMASVAAIPLKSKNTTLQLGNPWWDNECTLMLRQRRSALQYFKDLPNMDNYIKAKRAIAQSKRFFKQRKKEKFIKFCGSLNRNSNLTYVWNKVKKFSGISLNNNFSRVSDNIRLDMLHKMAVIRTQHPNFYLLSVPDEIELFTVSELKISIQDKKNSAPGLDEVTYTMLQNTPDKVLETLVNIYNRCLVDESLPASWKRYNIICLLKPNKNPNTVDSYRPIVLSSCCLKTLEIMIKNKLEWLMENKEVFPWFQTGFRKGQATYNALAILTSDVYLAFGQNYSVLAVFLDIKSAYDHVDIYLLYNKLINLETPIELANLIFKILKNRLIYSKNDNGENIGPTLANSGLPQGSPLSTLLFNIYMRDVYDILPEDLNLIVYADDLVVYVKGKDINEMHNKMNQALNNIAKWLEENHLFLSADKCESVLFSKNNRIIQTPPIRLGNDLIRSKNEVKYLGMILNRNLKWDKHIEMVLDKAQKGINIMKTFCRVWWGADPTTLLTVFNALVRSHLDYGSIFIKPNNKKSLTKLNTLHYQGLRIALGCMKSTPINALLGEAADMNLEHRRKWLAVKFMSKIVCIQNHPLIPTLMSIRNSYNENVGFWKNKDCPYLIQGLNYLLPYINKIYKSELFPTFDIEFGHQIRNIKIINLGLQKDDLLAKENFLRNTDRYKQSHVFTYTDASKNSSKSGYGIYIPQINYKYSSRLPSELCICTAEIIAINEATKVIMRNNIEKSIIFSDSLSAITKLNKTVINSKNDYVSLRTKRLLLEANDNGFDIKIAWVPGHSRIAGNEMADTLANIGRNLNIPKNMNLDAQEIIPDIKRKIHEEHNAQWKTSLRNKGKSYAEVIDDFPKDKWFNNYTYIDRRHITTIIRMRTGHCLTTSHLYRIGIKEDPYCECGQVEDLEHIFLTCPINRIPGHDMYEEFRKTGITPPLNIKTVLSNLNNENIKIIIHFLNVNKINL